MNSQHWSDAILNDSVLVLLSTLECDISVYDALECRGTELSSLLDR